MDSLKILGAQSTKGLSNSEAARGQFTEDSHSPSKPNHASAGTAASSADVFIAWIAAMTRTRSVLWTNLISASSRVFEDQRSPQAVADAPSDDTLSLETTHDDARMEIDFFGEGTNVCQGLEVR